MDVPRLNQNGLILTANEHVRDRQVFILKVDVLNEALQIVT